MTISRTVQLITLLCMFSLALPALNAPMAYAQEETQARSTNFPASARPDQICLTWNGDPRNSIAVQWRTGLSIEKGVVQYRAKAESEDAVREVEAERSTLTDPLIANDPSVNRYTATLSGLSPGTAYLYRVGTGSDDGWGEWTEFSTAPDGPVSFSFIYMGDPQVGLAEWGRFLEQMNAAHPEAAFYVIAGDLVNRGNYREEWDAFFAAAEGLFDRRPVVPTIGNHEYSRGINPQLYLDHFSLPLNGPEKLPKEHTYSFQYSNTFFLVMDSNLPAVQQREWLQGQLANSDATWKFAVHHHPVYSSSPRRDNPLIRLHWASLYDEYHVDMALQGHDHAYLRTPPMRAGKPVDSHSEGTYYVVSNSGSKHYEQDPRDYTAVGFTKTPTYQIVEIETGEVDKMTYRAFDNEGVMRDEVIIEKPKQGP